jgi:hypothetical protein
MAMMHGDAVVLGYYYNMFACECVHGREREGEQAARLAM